jgi:hypothetical protein
MENTINIHEKEVLAKIFRTDHVEHKPDIMYQCAALHY